MTDTDRARGVHDDGAQASARPTRTLLLLRHAKSAWDDPALDDIERPLNARGARAADLMGAFVAAWRPQWIGCSLAQRTRQTLLPIINDLTTPADIVISDALYESSGHDYLDVLRGLPKAIERALVIGHNPALAEVLDQLAASGEPHARARIADKLPTGTLLVLECAIADWQSLRPGCARLAEAIRPADLADQP